MIKKLLMLIICFSMTMVTFGQDKPFDDNINWFNGNNGNANGHKPGHSNGNGHRPGHSNGNGHNHPAPVGTATLLLLLGLATGSIIYRISKNK